MAEIKAYLKEQEAAHKAASEAAAKANIDEFGEENPMPEPIVPSDHEEENSMIKTTSPGKQSQRST